MSLKESNQTAELIPGSQYPTGLDLSHLNFPNPDTELTLITETYKKGWVVVVDWGSTAIKIAGLGIMNDGNLNTYYEEPWLDWTEETEILQSANGPFKCIRDEHLDTTLQTVRDQVQDLVDFMQDTVAAPVILAETGFTNSLAVEWEDKNKQHHRVLLLDNPSLHTDHLYQNQLDALHAHGVKGDEKSLRIKTIMKILALQDDPELVEKICGKNVTFKDLKFTTMLGLISDEFRQQDMETGTPTDDLRALITDSNVPEISDIYSLLSDLGIRPDQFPITESDAIPSFLKIIALRENDWKSESKLIKYLRDKGIIAENAAVIVTDTVAKLSGRHLTYEKVSSGSFEHYITQRVAGGIIPHWFHASFKNEDGTIDYQAIHHKLSDLLQNQVNFDHFYYNPDDMSDGNDRGILLMHFDNGWFQLTPEDVANLPEDLRDEAYLALGAGVFFAIRKKIEQGLQPGAEMPQIVTYGGMGSHGTTSWLSLMKQVFPEVDIQRIEDMGGYTGSGYAAAESFGWDVPNINLDIRPVIDELNVDRRDEYEKWKNTSIKKAT